MISRAEVALVLDQAVEDYRPGWTVDSAVDELLGLDADLSPEERAALHWAADTILKASPVQFGHGPALQTAKRKLR